MKKRYSLLPSIVVLLIAATSALTEPPQAREESAPSPSPNYLSISEFEIAPGISVAGAVEKITGTVKALKNTGDYKSVKLYIHSTGPRLSLYVISEPKSWQAIETGWRKVAASEPGIRTDPVWFTHSDNIMTEIPVE